MNTTATDLPVSSAVDSSRAAEMRAAGGAVGSLSYNAVWTLLGNVVQSGCQWGLIVALAKLGEPALVGQFALAIAITSPIMLFAGCALRAVQATDTTRDFTFGDYLGFRVLSVVGAIGVILAVALVADLTPTERLVVVAVGLAKAFESLSDLLHGALQQREQMDRIGLSLIVRGCVTMAAAVVGFAVTGSLLIATGALVVASAAVFLLFDLPIQQTYGAGSRRPRFVRTRLAALWKLSLPLGLTVMLGALIANVPRYAIEHYLGDEALGIFSALAYVAIVGNLLASALAHAALPRLSRYWASAARPEFQWLLVVLLGCGGAVGLLGVGLSAQFGSTLLAWVYRPEYAAHQEVFLALAVSTALGLLVCFLDHALYAARRFRTQVPMNVAALAFIAVGSVWAVPSHGLPGAAWLVCLTMALQMLARLVVVAVLVRRGPESPLAILAPLDSK